MGWWDMGSALWIGNVNAINLDQLFLLYKVDEFRFFKVRIYERDDNCNMSIKDEQTLSPSI